MAIMDAIEATQSIGIAHGMQDNSHDEEETETTREEQEEMTVEDIMIKAINNIGNKPRIDTPIYFGSFNPKELIDWIGEMEKYFEIEWITDPMRVRFSITKLRSHASLWWDKLQLNRECGGKQSIKAQDRIV